MEKAAESIGHSINPEIVAGLRSMACDLGPVEPEKSIAYHLIGSDIR